MDRTKKLLPVLWSKIDIATLLEIEPKQLNLYLSDNCKNLVKYRTGKQYFRDSQVIDILKDLFPAKNDAEIRQMIGYKPQIQLK